MKKLLGISIILTLIFSCLNINISFAKELIKSGVKISAADYAPKWDEFCPPEYINAQYKEIAPYKIPKSENIWVAIRRFLCPFEIAADAMLYVNQAETNNYWAMRHKAFDGEVKNCLANQETATSCFMVVRQMEDNKNAMRTGQQLQQAQQMQQAAQFAAQQTVQNINNVQTQIQAQQMNNNLNNINSSINGLNSNLNTNLNNTNSSLKGINHSLNKINQKLNY